MCLGKKSQNTTPRKISQQFCPPKNGKSNSQKERQLLFQPIFFQGRKLLNFEGERKLCDKRMSPSPQFCSTTKKPWMSPKLPCQRAPKKPSAKASHSTIKKRDNWVSPNSVPVVSLNLYPLFLGRFFRDFPPGVREIQLSPENLTVKPRFYPSSCRKFLPKQHPIPRRVHDLGKLSQPSTWRLLGNHPIC